MNYIFNKVDNPIDFLYGSISAIRKSKLEPYDDSWIIAEDTELGSRLARKGGKIILDKSLQVVHLKKYNFLDFVINDFRIPYSWALLFLKNKSYKNILIKKKFAHASFKQIIGIIITPFMVCSLFFLFYPGLFFIFPVLLILVSFWLNYDFLKFLQKEKGNFFAVRAVFVALLDPLIMGLGVFAGFIDYFLRKRFRRTEIFQEPEGSLK